MATILGRSVGVLLASFAASNALAQPVTLSVSSGTASITSQTQSNGAWTVLIHVTAGSPAVFTVTTSTSNVLVEKVEVECDADCLMTVNQSGGGSFSEIRSIVEKATSSPESFDIDSIVLSGTLGPGDVAAEAIDEIQVGNNLTATVTAGPRASLADSDITLIDVGGDIVDADIYCRTGSITQVLVGGIIDGNPSGPDRVQIQARDGIREIEAEAMESVDIWANYTGVGLPLATGPISRLECRSGAYADDSVFVAYSLLEDVAVNDPGIFIDGDADGAIWFQDTVTCPIEITGDLVGSIFVSNRGLDHGAGTSGDITIHGDMAEGSYIWCWEPDGFIRTLVRVGGSCDGEFIVEGLVESAEVGQVIFNAYNNEGEWNGDFQIGVSTILSPVPDYDEQDLIGAVGLVPFAVHELDCIPHEGGTLGPTDYTVTLGFYGPVTWDSGFPFLIQSSPNGSTWTTDPNWAVASGQGTRFITLIYVGVWEPTYPPGELEYRIVPFLTGSNALLCDDLLTVEDVPAADFEFRFFTP